MLNHITIMGRLTRDPELRYTQSQTPVASFTLAVDRDFGGRDGAEKQTDFIDCVAWRSTGEFVSKYFQKGSMAIVSGRLQMRDWTDKEGNKRTSAEIVADNVYFGESKRRDGEQREGYGPRDSYGQRDSYGSRGSYGQRENYAPRDSYGSRDSRQDAAPRTPAPSAFAELDDGDGELPF